MKFPFVNKSFSSSLSSNSNSSSWVWDFCNQNPRTTSFESTIITINPNDIEDEEEEEDEDEDEKPLTTIIYSSSSSSSTSSTIDGIKELRKTDSIEHVIKGIKPSERFIVERRGQSNSILEEMRNKDSYSCPWNQSTLSLISVDSWRKWLKYTRFITAREASKCILKSSNS